MGRFTARRSRTKIVATVGPACEDPGVLLQMMEAGADVFRVNMAHGDRAGHEQLLKSIRQASQQAGWPVGILIDLAGPKIRLGELPQPVECRSGEKFEFVSGDAGPGQLTSNYAPLIDELSVGDAVLLADGTVVMRVVERPAGRAVCEVISSGLLRSRQGINLPGVKLSTPALTDRDRDNLAWAARSEADFVSLSFVRSPDDMRQVKQLLQQAESQAMTVAKIEKREALEQIEEIVAVADAVMVARGDLGVEIDVAETPAAQKRIVQVCNEMQKPVIVATQMLDSMQRSRRPTRAEASDVCNAVLDGADACMLSGETAIGQYPVETVAMMNSIMRTSERLLTPSDSAAVDSRVHPVTSAVVRAAGAIAAQIQAKLVVIASRSGATARIKAKQRGLIPTIGISNSEATLRQMCLFWGIVPVAGTADHGPELREFAERWARQDGSAQAGDKVVFVTGSGLVPSGS